MSIDFSPSRFLRNGHVQTVLVAVPLGASRLRGAHVVQDWIALPNGGELLTQGVWHEGAPRKTVLLVHGVGGSTESTYMRRSAMAFYQDGANVVLLNLQGAGKSVSRAKKLYHAGITEDLRAAVAHFEKDLRVESIRILGFSLGANLALKYAAELSLAPSLGKVKAVCAVSPPLDLSAGSRLLERTESIPYRAYILSGLIPAAAKFARLHGSATPYNLRDVLRVRTIRAFDEAVQVPMHKFADAEDYYARSSSGPLLGSIRVPTLIVHAEDDPVVPASIVAPWLDARSSDVHVEWSKHGGHVGWIDGFSSGAWIRNWANDHALRFFAKN
ncbi:MAG: alpha/beta fold hydrolase [Polyangiaceae bacterium]|nr:alpha/beta fold hydrolase [Polyangiaceae bacterium]